MFHSKDILAENIKILNTKDVSIINNNDEDYIFSALTVEGGGVFKKGLAIGMQEKMIPGLLLYDDENFYGFSEKHGLSMLSVHHEYNELEIPDSIFETKTDRNILHPTIKGDTFQHAKETEKNESKQIHIDLQIKDTSYFYLILPEKYSFQKSILTFDITCIYDINSIVSHVSLYIINQSAKNANIHITNPNCYYDISFQNEIEKKSIVQIYIDIIPPDYYMIRKNVFFQK